MRGKVNAQQIMEINLKLIGGESYDCFIKKEQYQNRRIALSAVSPMEGPIARLSVNLVNDPCPEGHTFIKDYSENEGMKQQLIDAGVIEPTGIFVRSGWVEVELCKVLI